MGRPGLAQCWVDAILEEKVAEPNLKAPKIADKLSDRLQNGSLRLTQDAQKQVPDERTIRKVLETHSILDAKQQVAYRRCVWPESFVECHLPWEASRIVLDLLDFTSRQHWPRPTIQQAVWFWRLTLASAEMPIMIRWEWAMTFASDPELKLDALVRLAETQLAKNTWKIPQITEAKSDPQEPPSNPQLIGNDTSVTSPGKTKKGKSNGRQRQTTKTGR